MSFLYSFCGGMFCYLVMLCIRKIVTEKQIWICSIIGAIAHIVGQITVAMAVTQCEHLHCDRIQQQLRKHYRRICRRTCAS